MTTMSEQDYEVYKTKVESKLKEKMQKKTEEHYAELSSFLTDFCREHKDKTELECLTAFVLAQLAALTVHIEFQNDPDTITKEVVNEITAEETQV